MDEPAAVKPSAVIHAQAVVDPQAIVDNEHLRILAICYYVLGGVTAVFACFGLIYVAMGLFLSLAPDDFFRGPRGRGNPPPAFLGYFMVLAGSTIVLAGWTVGGLTVLAARSIQTRRRRMFVLVMAAINCINFIFFPLGAGLGIFAFLVLTRKRVQGLYDSQA
jgi:hypothetical protein